MSHPGDCRLPAGRPAALARPARSETSPSGRSVLAHFWNSYACTTCSGTSPSSAAARLPRRGGAAHRGAPSRKDPASSDADSAGTPSRSPRQRSCAAPASARRSPRSPIGPPVRGHGGAGDVAGGASLAPRTVCPGGEGLEEKKESLSL